MINSYYDPFPGDVGCLSDLGMTAANKQPLENDLAALNGILHSGAETAGFLSAQPDFGGHGICSTQP